MAPTVKIFQIEFSFSKISSVNNEELNSSFLFRENLFSFSEDELLKGLFLKVF